MAHEEPFKQLILRVRSGDPDAAAELVKEYERAIRTAVRVRLKGSPLHRVMDSEDICQSVLMNFFPRAALGRFDLERPEQLRNLLVTMAINRLRSHAKKEHAARRDARRIEKDVYDEMAVADPASSPSQVVANREILQEFRRRLSEDERLIADLRNEGHEWAEIAAKLSTTPDAVRMRHARAVERVALELGLDEMNEA